MSNSCLGRWLLCFEWRGLWDGRWRIDKFGLVYGSDTSVEFEL